MVCCLSPTALLPIQADIIGCLKSCWTVETGLATKRKRKTGGRGEEIGTQPKEDIHIN